MSGCLYHEIPGRLTKTESWQIQKMSNRIGKSIEILVASNGAATCTVDKREGGIRRRFTPGVWYISCLLARQILILPLPISIFLLEVSTLFLVRSNVRGSGPTEGNPLEERRGSGGIA